MGERWPGGGEGAGSKWHFIEAPLEVMGKEEASRETLTWNMEYLVKRCFLTITHWKMETFFKTFGVKSFRHLTAWQVNFWQCSSGYPERILRNKNICAYYIADLNQNFPRIRTCSKTGSLPVMMTVTTPTFPVSLFIINNIRYIGQPHHAYFSCQSIHY